jgi:cytochrome c
MSSWREAALVAVLVAASAATEAAERLGLGRTPAEQEIAAWDIDVRGPDGAGLPPGRGSVAEGERIFEQRCAGCHGDFAEGRGLFPALAGGRGTLGGDQPQRTIGSFWPYAPTLFDYIRRAQPFAEPGSLAVAEIYAVAGYLLHLNDLLPADAVADADVLRGIRMPNRDGFLADDPRPDVQGEACVSGCRSGPAQVTSAAGR